MKDVMARIQRELPDTDRDRYDVAYERGRAQARSGLLAGGLALGSAVGAGLMWLMDPARGAERRAQLASRATGLKNTLGRTAGGKAEDLQNRVSGFAIERGIKQPPDASSNGHHDTSSVDDAGLGAGYRDGFGQTTADPAAPGSRVPDPIAADEIVEYGASGPVAGAARDDRESVVSSQARDEEEAATGR
jgi:hypothetical protein